MATRKRDEKTNYDFYSHYKENLAKIMEARDLLSDSRRINLDEAKNKWVNAQLSAERKKAAQNLLLNTHYITFNMLFSAVRDLIASIYTPLKQKMEAGKLAVVSLYVGKPNSDTYFIAIIAVYFIRLLGYPDPSFIYHNSRLGAIPNEIIIYLNDISYYGPEIIELATLAIKQNRNTTFIIGLVVTTEATLKYLKSFPFTFHYIHYIPALKTTLGIFRFMRMCYFFAPGNEGNTQVSVYFDHTLGNINTTFIRALALGPILPPNLDYHPLDEHNMYALINGIMEQPKIVKFCIFNREDEEFNSCRSIIETLAHEDDAVSVSSSATFTNVKQAQEDDAVSVSSSAALINEKQICFHPLISNFALPPLDVYTNWSYFDLMTGYLSNSSRHVLEGEKLDPLLENIKPFYEDPAYRLK